LKKNNDRSDELKGAKKVESVDEFDDILGSLDNIGETVNVSNKKNELVSEKKSFKMDEDVGGMTKVEMQPQLVGLEKQGILPSFSNIDMNLIETIIEKAQNNNNLTFDPVNTNKVEVSARKVSSRGVGALQESEIDEVFDLLRDTVKESGVMGVCDLCHIPILIQYSEALGKRYHTEHFKCTKYNKVIATDKYFVTDQSIWCVECFDSLKGGRCAGCEQVIAGNFIVALGKKWHPEHFSCTTCKKSFTDGKCYEYNGMPYCETHYRQAFFVCKLCNQPITSKAVEALDAVWHPEHVACKICLKPYIDGFFTHEGYIYCPQHYTDAVRGSKKF